MSTTGITATDNSAILQDYIAAQKQAAAEAAAKTSAQSSSGAETSISRVTGDFNTFLKILTAQLKNQNPESATDPNQFTQQLVQFSGIEQQINTNSKLDQLLSAIKPNGISPLLSYVGKYVEAPTDDQLVVQGGGSQFAYTLPTEAQSVSIEVKDNTGKTVNTLVGPTNAGLNRVIWDGKNTQGDVVADGVYTFKLTTKDVTGKAMDVTDKRLIGLVTSIQTDGDGKATLSVGNISIKDTDVSAVFNTQTTYSSS